MLGWMHWTWKSALAFALLAALLSGLAVLDRYYPGYGRKGFLPIITTRGDRIFMSLASFLALVFAWLKYLPEVTTWWVFPISGAVAFLIIKWA
jgi:predicted small integral membrane protein